MLHLQFEPYAFVSLNQAALGRHITISRTNGTMFYLLDSQDLLSGNTNTGSTFPPDIRQLCRNAGMMVSLLCRSISYESEDIAGQIYRLL
jgi:hypothetical protein